MNVNTFLKKFPFVSLIKTKKEGDILGIILLQNKKSVYYYNIEDPSMSEKLSTELMQYGQTWWNESNRKLPISLFFKHDMLKFEPYIRCLGNKFVAEIKGPVVNLISLKNKQNKKTTITL